MASQEGVEKLYGTSFSLRPVLCLAYHILGPESQILYLGQILENLLKEYLTTRKFDTFTHAM